MWVPRPQGREVIVGIKERPATVNGLASWSLLYLVRVQVCYTHDHVGQLSDEV